MIAMKLCEPLRNKIEAQYQNLRGKPFYESLIKYLISGLICCMVLEGDNVVAISKKMIGYSEPGTIRGDYCMDLGKNVIHGSDSVEEAERTIQLWFKPEEIFGY